MKINIVNYEDGINEGILSKFAYSLDREFKVLGHKSSVRKISFEADVNLHINYLPYRFNKNIKTINALMITHIWEGYKLDALKEGMKTADLGICMSEDTRQQLIKWGLPENKLFTILPAHDGRPRRHQVVAILTNVYPDGCKRTEMFTKLVKTINNDEWAFRIMGKDWSDILKPLVKKGLQVDYYSKFYEEVYPKILDSSDYYLYFGKDEGSMGLLDAKNAGLKIIAPNIGFNIDIGVDYPFDNQKELNEIFKNLNHNPVKDWTWDKYAKEHINLFKKCQ